MDRAAGRCKGRKGGDARSGVTFELLTVTDVMGLEEIGVGEDRA
jgi:hypothetical protein